MKNYLVKNTRQVISKLDRILSIQNNQRRKGKLTRPMSEKSLFDIKRLRIKFNLKYKS